MGSEPLRYLFLVRQFPDLDHFSPLIYELSRLENREVAVLCQNIDYDLSSETIIDYFKGLDNVRIESAYNLYDRRNTFYYFSRILVWAYKWKIGKELFYRLSRYVFNDKWAGFILDYSRPVCVISDFQKKTKHKGDLMASAARARGVPVVLMSHGVTMRLNDLDKKRKLPPSDYKLFPNKLKYSHFIEDSDKPDTIRILGSPRYCNQWEQKYNEILRERIPEPDLPSGDGRLNVLFFGRPRINLTGDGEVVNSLKGLDFINLHSDIKPRIGRHNRSAQAYPSARLIQWADAVVMSISSIALEVLWQGKALLYLKWLAPDDVCVFERYRACWVLNSMDELMEALSILRKDPSYRPYEKQGPSRLFEDVVYCGDAGYDVMGAHLEFFKSLENRL